ncbi:MAG: 1-acyl-sn-glycerol-3-phosphate acyltransferase [Gammaproteobacteria bacterium]
MNEYTRTNMRQLPDMDSLLALIRALVSEVYPDWETVHFSADTRLERELGLDSMARVELCARIESSLGVHLDDSTAISAATANDLMQAIVAHASGNQATISHPDEPLTAPPAASELLMGSLVTGETAAAAPQHTGHTPGEWLYAIYVWPVFIVLGLLTWLAVVLAPLESWRQRLAKTGARLLFSCSFTPFEVSGLEHIDPATSHVLVANHASYLDGFIVTAALNIPVHFIVKGELSGVWPARVLLQRFGVEFVERFNANRSSGDIARIVEKSRSGRNIVFFPEGTFTVTAGLRPFRLGAFVTAAESDRAVIPIAINGARTIQRGSDFFPRRGRIRVIICPPLLPEGRGWQAALKLRDAARREISQFCGEIDLVENSASRASGNQ